MHHHHFIHSLPQLVRYLDQKGIKHKIKIAQYQDPFSLLIPTYYVDLINWSDLHDPLGKMVLADRQEKTIQQYELVDPIADKAHSPVPGIIHRHTNRCLLMLTNACHVHCRFCFRKNMLSTNHANLKQAIAYIRSHTQLEEVIFSGGDPLALTDYMLRTIMDQIDTIDHVRIVRFHTRTPAVYPMRINTSFLESLASSKSLIVVLHINHVREITQAFRKAVHKLKKANMLLLAQTVLLKEVNDTATDLSQLFTHLIEIGVKPYYLHHLDKAAGTHHFRISIKQGLRIMRELRTAVSGTSMPHYVIDLPGGGGKVPVNEFREVAPNIYETVDFEGNKVRYEDPIYE